MPTQLTRTHIVWGTAALVAALAAVAIASDPAHAWAYITALVFVPAAAALTTFLKAALKWEKPGTQQMINYALIWSGFILSASILIAIWDDLTFLPRFADAQWITWVIIAVGWVGFSLLSKRTAE